MDGLNDLKFWLVIAIKVGDVLRYTPIFFLEIIFVNHPTTGGVSCPYLY
jgi:hypothetical protein